jgi:hypothetical protein
LSCKFVLHMMDGNMGVSHNMNCCGIGELIYLSFFLSFFFFFFFFFFFL